MAKYVLYGGPGSGSVSVEAALQEAGADFDLVHIDTNKKENFDAKFTAINPRQQIPALILLDGTVVTECAAILLHIADAFPTANLAPKPGSSARALHDRWLVFLAVNIYEGELRKGYSDRYSDDIGHAQAIAGAAGKYVERHYGILEQQIGAGPYFLGQQFSVLDIYIWMVAQWMDQDWLVSNCPKVLALANAVKARPKINKVQASHFGAA
ncbi:glutathione S-transferase family protein [Aestuariivirga litoralis]|uniref:glutathione S-transferase family protein n=1 Tax=Aestuariivirga litoralis TaxID=2650924 RepID=UPI0018C76356|nr:glutathione S-transferase family protein [Aestuariivirga litoralis]MBG1233294.1 glutathione S-transferase family protein [Aestuariivirga litoralis]